MKCVYTDDYHLKCREASKKTYEKDRSVKQIYYLKNKLKVKDEDIAEYTDRKDLLVYLQKLSFKTKYGIEV